MIFFDQDLKNAQGRFSINESQKKGEDLILEIKEKGVGSKVIVSLFTHTTTEIDKELINRQEICDRISALNPSDFFLLAKSRINKHELFADGLKKVCLNTFCEKIKTSTIKLIEQAQKKAIERLNEFDTYDFDHTVFKSSFTEGVWEPETLLRITDVIFKDELRDLMIKENYLVSVNPTISFAREISNIDFNLGDEITKKPYGQKLQLRHQELFESEVLLNKLRRPIDNGDIFSITEGEKKGKTFILIGQECDLMVRSGVKDKGERGARNAVLLEIKTITLDKLLNDIKKRNDTAHQLKKIANNFFADKIRLQNFDKSNPNKIYYVTFSHSSSITIDLNILDLIVFNENGVAVIDLMSETYNKDFHNFAWNSRYEIIRSEFENNSRKLDTFINALGDIDDECARKEIQIELNRNFSFLEKAGIQPNYTDGKFEFGIKRISRLRMPKSKYLLDSYYQHLSRFAEPHDFAG